jgi:tripartite-type tricarboxylate transporter receptor subunit TctC
VTDEAGARDSANRGLSRVSHAAAAHERIRTVVVEDHEDIARLVAMRIATLIRERNAAGEQTVLGLATGSTPIGVYRELIRMHKGKRLTYATAGVGTSSHIAADYLLRVLAKLDAVHVPFRGGAPALSALLGSQVDLMSGSGGALPFIKQGRLKVLGISSLKRSTLYPDAPTVSEAGFPGFEERSWVGYFAPARTPAAIVARLNREINQALAHPDVKSRFIAQGMELHPGSVADFARHVRAEVAMWAKIIKTTGVKAE